MQTLDRLSIRQAAAKIATEQPLTFGPIKIERFIESPFFYEPRANTLIKREERRLYRAVQSGELICYRDDSNVRSTIYLRWSDVVRWHRRKYPEMKAINA